jgi:hypothetical protein
MRKTKHPNLPLPSAATLMQIKCPNFPPLEFVAL